MKGMAGDLVGRVRDIAVTHGKALPEPYLGAGSSPDGGTIGSGSIALISSRPIILYARYVASAGPS